MSSGREKKILKAEATFIRRGIVDIRDLLITMIFLYSRVFTWQNQIKIMFLIGLLLKYERIQLYICTIVNLINRVDFTDKILQVNP